jgi:hypothetical protein
MKVENKLPARALRIVESRRHQGIACGIRGSAFITSHCAGSRNSSREIDSGQGSAAGLKLLRRPEQRKTPARQQTLLSSPDSVYYHAWSLIQRLLNPTLLFFHSKPPCLSNIPFCPSSQRAMAETSSNDASTSGKCTTDSILRIALMASTSIMDFNWCIV